NFHLPKDKRSNDAWLRVRDEGDKVTLALKMSTGSNIEDQKEISLTIGNFDTALELLESIGCKRKAYQESKRELWKIGQVEITIDEWPGLEPFIEIEGQSEDDVKKCADVLGFDYTTALFSSVGGVYKIKYGISLDEIEEKVGDITFGNKKLMTLRKV
ncbi:MAG: CYTH domain-containing protein, partial [Patescibacteria group bacterium]